MLSCLFHSYIVGKLEKDARDRTERDLTVWLIVDGIIPTVQRKHILI